MEADRPSTIRVLDKYEVIRRVAQGGMGEIFLARQTGVAGFNRLVILKTLLPELAEQSEIKDQFLDEARIGATLNHPNIVGIHEIGQWHGLYFLVMEFIDGDTLAGLQRAAAKKKASIPWVVSAQIVRDTARGLDHAHHALDPTTGTRLNIIHRDVTPQNIMVRLDGVVKVVDFGIAKSAGSDPRTAAGEVKGKLSYLSPEQISGATTTVDHRADQFSLGIVLWELCTGRRLFNQKNPLDIFKKILAHDIPSPTAIVPQVPPPLERIVMKMLAHDPAQRYARCADAALDLQAWLDSLSGRVDPTSQFVDRLIGEDARARLADLTPQPVTIVGLQQPAKAPVEALVPCQTCGFGLTPRAKFCTECGTPTEASGRFAPSPQKAPSIEPARGAPAPSLSAPASVDDLFGVAHAARPKTGSMPAAPVDARTRTEPQTPSPAVSVTAPHARPYASTPPMAPISGLGAALPLDEHVPGMARRPTTAPAMPASRAHTPSQPVRASAVTPARPASTPPTLATTPPQPTTTATRSTTPPTTVAMSHQPPSRSHTPSAPVRASSFPAPTTPRGTPRVIDAEVPRGANLSMDDLFAVPGPTARAAPEPARVAKKALLLGRDSELQRATQLLHESAHKTRALVFIGESGTGKTAFLGACKDVADELGFLVLTGQGADRGLASPLDLVRSLLFSQSPTDEDGVLASMVQSAGLPAPVAHRAESALVGVPGPPAMCGEHEHLLYAAALAKLIGAIGRGRSVCILVDDLHRADTASLRVLGMLPASVPDGVAIIATAHRNFDHPSLPLTELAPLDVASTVQVIETAAGATLPPDAVRKVLERAEGNPAHARELVEFLVTEGGVVVEGSVAKATPALARIAMPPDARFHTTTRVRCLGNATFEFLKLAASVGVEFTLDEIAPAFARATEPQEAAQRAEREGILVRSASGRRYKFARDLYYDVVVGERRPAEVTTLHKRLAGAYHGRGVAAAYAEMHHLLLAGEPNPALVGLMHDALAARGLMSMLASTLPRSVDLMLSRLAAGQADPNALAAITASATTALTQLAPVEASQLATRALARLGLLQVDPILLARAFRARGLAMLADGEAQSGARDFEVAAGLAARHGQTAVQAEILVDLARAHEKAGDIAGASKQYAAALQLTSTTEPHRWRAAAGLASLFVRSGQAEHATTLLADADQNARASESGEGFLRCRLVESQLLKAEARAHDAVLMLEDTIHLAVDQNDLIAEAQLRRELAHVLASLGANERRIEQIQRAAQLAKEAGWSQGVVEILGDLRAFGRSGLM